MLKERLVHDKFSYLESLTLVFIFLFFGYLVDVNDICMLHTQISYLTMILAIITLFHGISNGLFALSLFGLAMYFFYPVFAYVEFLKELVLVLIFGEFNYHWSRKIDQHSSEVHYLNAKLDELGKAFYTLKISHDQLENNYVLKPMSLRNSIKTIKEDYTSDEIYFEKFLLLLEKSFNISEASIATANDLQLTVVAHTDKITKLINDDPLIQKVYDKRRPIYISDNIASETPYIAVIPAIKNTQIIGLLLVEKMPFMSFNKDNLISISILFEYFFDEVHKLETIKNINPQLSMVNESFVFEYYRLKEIEKEYGSKSTLVAFKTKSELIHYKLNELTNSFLRSLDITMELHQDDYFYVVILFAFADKSSATGFLNRLESKIDKEDQALYDYTVFNIDQEKIFKEYLKVDLDAF